MSFSHPHQAGLAFVAASLARINRKATISDVIDDLKSHGARYKLPVLRTYLQRMHADGLIDKFDDGCRNSHEGEYVWHVLTKAGRRFVQQWRRALT